MINDCCWVPARDIVVVLPQSWVAAMSLTLELVKLGGDGCTEFEEI